jgi:DNA polymerase III sliding clamp (beta) subunit (PCNA family)
MKITASLYAAALAVAAIKDVRFYLNGVLVQPCKAGGALLVGTDGHRLLAVWDAEATDVPEAGCIVPRLKLSAAAVKPGSGSLEFDGARVTLPDGATLPATYIDGRYPDWRVVLPLNAKEGAISTFNPELLDGLDSVARAFGQKYNAIELAGTGEGRAILVRYPIAVPAIGVIMPIRTDIDREPTWL